MALVRAQLPSALPSNNFVNRPLHSTGTGQFLCSSFLTSGIAELPINLLKFVSYDEQLSAQHFTLPSFPNAGSQELKNNRYYILCFRDKTFGKESSNLEIKSLLKAILHPCQSDTLCDQRRCPRGKLSAVDRVDYLDLLSVLNSLTVAETFSTTLFSLFGSKVNILTLTVPNVLENNLIIKRTVLGSDNVCVCISTFSQGFCSWVFQC